MPDKKTPEESVADLVDGAAASFAPQPHKGGGPLEDGGDSNFANDVPADDIPSYELALIDPEIVKLCAREPQNDTGNGQRLLRYFGGDLLHVREVGWHAWSGRHWQREGGDETAVLRAQQTAPRIALEADYLAAAPSEEQAIDDGEQAEADLRRLLARLPRAQKDWTDDNLAEVDRLERAIAAGKDAKAELQKRRLARRRFAVSSGNGSRIASMIAQALPHRTVSPAALDADPLAFNCENATLRFECYEVPDLECPDPDAERKKEFWIVRACEQRREDLITKLAPVTYEPHAQCPRFAEFLKMVQPKQALRDFLQCYHGYALLGLTGEQCLVLNLGIGANGKSTFIEIIARVMGDYALTMAFESLAGEGVRSGNQSTPDIARLPGARLVRASEPERGVYFKESLIKSLTGGEPMLARHNFKDFFEFVPVFKLALSANQKPEIGGVDLGIWRRIRLVPWDVTIQNMRPFDEVMAEFWEERSGILNWLIEGALRYLNEGLIVPPEVSEATGDYREEMDPVGGFVRDCVTRAPADRAATGSGQHVPARTMYDAFAAWCEANAVRPWREKSFATAMSQKGFVKERDAQGRRYVGVALHDVPDRKSRREEPPHPAAAGEEIPA